jgi:hypothetical protein
MSYLSFENRNHDTLYGSCDEHAQAYFDNRAIAAPPADLPPPGPVVTCVSLHACRKCGGPLRKARAASTCELCFAEMQARAERQEEIV